MRRKTIRPVKTTCPHCEGSGKLEVYLGSDLRALREAIHPPVSIRELARRLNLSNPYLVDVELGRRAATPRIVAAYEELAQA